MNNTTNNSLDEIKYYVKELKIPGIVKDLKTNIEEAYSLDKSYEEFLKELFEKAYDVRKENGKKNRIKNAKFPYKKYLDEIKTDYLPPDAKIKFKELKTLKFIEENRNVILAGNPGTGNYRKY
ncbi:MAG: ATP-binding protein [Bacillota bacterium]|nr:ATP-binding protein [Bacillota bacterium]